MHSTLATLLDRLDDPRLVGSGVVPWGAPVPSFGDLRRSRIATVGLNPSNREFMDEEGTELQGLDRRFHTLQSLNIDSWLEADARHLERIVGTCANYFRGNPYDRWFTTLEKALAHTGASFYDPVANACHLDLIPYATAQKWTNLTVQERNCLLDSAGDTLGLLLRDSPVEILVLNGRSVVNHFEEISGTALRFEDRPEWALPRRSSEGVVGVAFAGHVDRIGSVWLGRNVTVLGYNHNLQSSFGVTKMVIKRIARWIGSMVSGTHED